MKYFLRRTSNNNNNNNTRNNNNNNRNTKNFRYLAYILFYTLPVKNVDNFKRVSDEVTSFTSGYLRFLGA